MGQTTDRLDLTKFTNQIMAYYSRNKTNTKNNNDLVLLASDKKRIEELENNMRKLKNSLFLVSVKKT